MGSIPWSGKFDESGDCGIILNVSFLELEGHVKEDERAGSVGGSGGPVIMEMNHYKKGAERKDPPPGWMKVRATMWAKHFFLSLHLLFISKMLEERTQVATAPTGHKSGLPEPRIFEAANPPEALRFESLIDDSSRLSGAANQQHDQCQDKRVSCRPPS